MDQLQLWGVNLGYHNSEKSVIKNNDFPNLRGRIRKQQLLYNQFETLIFFSTLSKQWWSVKKIHFFFKNTFKKIPLGMIAWQKKYTTSTNSIPLGMQRDFVFVRIPNGMRKLTLLSFSTELESLRDFLNVFLKNYTYIFYTPSQGDSSIITSFFHLINKLMRS